MRNLISFGGQHQGKDKSGMFTSFLCPSSVTVILIGLSISMLSSIFSCTNAEQNIFVADAKNDLSKSLRLKIFFYCRMASVLHNFISPHLSTIPWMCMATICI
jgi:hypothetical protein